MSFTFKISDVYRPPDTGLLSTVPLREALDQIIGGPIEACASSATVVIAADRHPFIAAADVAFNCHVPLVLTPDAVWLCLAQGFASHACLHAESLRQHLVQHAGRALTEVRRDDFVKGLDTNPWPEVFGAFSDAIAAQAGRAHQLIVKNFSTTGPLERAAFEITLMDAMQEYFRYELTTLCGIPEITLTGTREDWCALRRHATLFGEYDLGWWVESLLPVLDQMIAATSGQVDLDFWQSLFNVAQASGGPYMTGWINVFFPYLATENGPERNEYVTGWRDGLNRDIGGGPNWDGLPPGLSRAPFIWKYLGKEIPMELLSGFVGMSQDAESLAICPIIGWAVREKQDGPLKRAMRPPWEE